MKKKVKEEINKEDKAKEEKVGFLTTKRVPRRVKISFNTAYGKKVSFMATKRVPRRVKVIFYEIKIRKNNLKRGGLN